MKAIRFGDFARKLRRSHVPQSVGAVGVGIMSTPVVSPRKQHQQECIDRVTQLIDKGHPDSSMRDWAWYFLSIINWIWGAISREHHFMDIDGVVHYKGGILFLESKTFLDGRKDCVLDRMSMTLERLDGDQSKLDKFLAGEPVRKRVNASGWLEENGTWGDSGQGAMFERLVCMGDHFIEVVFPWGKSVDEMEGFGSMRYLKVDIQIGNSRKNGSAYLVECQLHKGAGARELNDYIVDWKRRVVELNQQRNPSL